MCVNCFCNKTSVLKSFLQQKSVRWLYLRQKSVRKSFSRRKKYVELQFDVQVKIICAVFVTSSPFYGDITILHAAPKSVKRVKSSAQILDMMHRWWLTTMSKMESSDDRSYLQVHRWRVNACQKWSPLMTGASSKCICGIQLPEKWLIHYYCLLLFTCPEQCEPSF